MGWLDSWAFIYFTKHNRYCIWKFFYFNMPLIWYLVAYAHRKVYFPLEKIKKTQVLHAILYLRHSCLGNCPFQLEPSWLASTTKSMGKLMATLMSYFLNNLYWYVCYLFRHKYCFLCPFCHICCLLLLTDFACYQTLDKPLPTNNISLKSVLGPLFKLSFRLLLWYLSTVQQNLSIRLIRDCLHSWTRYPIDYHVIRSIWLYPSPN